MTGKYVNNTTRGGIDWWRYCITILEPLLLLFTKEYNIEQVKKGKPLMIV